MTAVEMWVECGRLALLVAAAVAVYFGPLRSARIAALRQDLFAIRNELWDRMREYGTLDATAHRGVRKMLNMLVRAAPVLNLFSLLYIVLRSPAPVEKSEEPALSALIEEVRDEQAREALRQAMEAATSVVVRQLFWRSFPGIVVTPVAWAVLRLLDAISAARGLHDRSREWARKVIFRVGQDNPMTCAA